MTSFGLLLCSKTLNELPFPFSLHRLIEPWLLVVFSKTHVYTRSHHHMHNARCQVECLCENMLSIYRMMCRINLLPINICFWFVLFFVCSPCVSTSLFFLRGQYTFRAKRNNKLKMYIDSSFFSFLCLPEFISCM